VWPLRASIALRGFFVCSVRAGPGSPKASTSQTEAPEGLTYLGRTDSGYDVEINRLVTDSDLTIYINTVVWRGFNGGWKSVCVGLGSYRCIRWHHTPDSMSMSNNSTGSATVSTPCTGS
jgi:nickel-dependent lactate racemase